MGESERVELLKKLKTGTRYLYLVTDYGNNAYIMVKRAYTGIYTGIDEDKNVIFTHVYFCHPRANKDLHYLDDGRTANIPLKRILSRESFLPTNQEGEPIEVNSIDDLMNERCCFG